MIVNAALDWQYLGDVCFAKKYFQLSVRLAKIIFPNLFLVLLFMDFTALFGIIHGIISAISANFYIVLLAKKN